MSIPRPRNLNVRARIAEARVTAAELLDDAGIAANFARDLPGWVRQTVTVDAAARDIRERLATRDQRFLANAARLIYAVPDSPYRALLRLAGCELGDLRTLVGRDGLNGALAVLAQGGVYVTLDELKGRADAVRGSQRFRFRREQFDNRQIRAHVVIYSGGTRGRPTRIRRSLALLDHAAATTAVVLAAHRLHNPQHVLWLTGPIGWLLAYTRIGQTPTHWFHPLSPLPRRVRLGAQALRNYGRLIGVSFPVPQYADLQQPERLAAWLARQRDGSRPLVVTTIASAATRVAIAARERGMALDHVAFNLTSEPTTTARHAHIVTSGAGAIVHYAAREAPNLTYSCATPDAVDDVHVMTDCYAMIAHQRPAAADRPPTNALLMTSLSAAASTILLNTELGDAGHLTARACGCALGALGLTTHLREIRSFEKLTGEGVTFGTGALEHLIEQVLPARFGGTSMDYQIVEYQAADSFTRVSIRVHPAVGAIDEAAVVASALAELERGSMIDHHQAALWRAAGTVSVVRQPPLASAVGKVLPFHFVRHTLDNPRSVR